MKSWRSHFVTVLFVLFAGISIRSAYSLIRFASNAKTCRMYIWYDSKLNQIEWLCKGECGGLGLCESMWLSNDGPLDLFGKKKKACTCDPLGDEQRPATVDGCYAWVDTSGGKFSYVCNNESCTKSCKAIPWSDIPKGKANMVPICECQ